MKRVIAIGVSVLILAALYWRLDWRQVGAVWRGAHGGWLLATLALLLPLNLLTAWRLCLLLPQRGTLGFGEANRLILAAATLNLVLPSKLGDVAKAVVLRQRHGFSGGLALSLVICERACDMLAMLSWCLLGLLLLPHKVAWQWSAITTLAAIIAAGALLLLWPRWAHWVFGGLARLAPARLRPRLTALGAGWEELLAYLRGHVSRWLAVTLISLVLWGLHFVQLWLFLPCLGAHAPFTDSLACTGLALAVGVLPISFAGVGTRDAALVLFYAAYFPAATAAALGVLCTSRYLLLGLAGLPFLHGYLATARAAKAE